MIEKICSLRTTSAGKRWTKCLQSARKSGFVFLPKNLFTPLKTTDLLLSLLSLLSLCQLPPPPQPSATTTSTTTTAIKTHHHRRSLSLSLSLISLSLMLPPLSLSLRSLSLRSTTAIKTHHHRRPLSLYDLSLSLFVPDVNDDDDEGFRFRVWVLFAIDVDDDEGFRFGGFVCDVDDDVAEVVAEWRWSRYRRWSRFGGFVCDVVLGLERRRWWRSGGGADGVGGGDGVGVEMVVAAEVGGGDGGGRGRRRRRGEEVGRGWKWMEHVCVVKRSRRPFLMKGLRENKQSAASKRLPASARRRHKWPEVLLAKKQIEP
ncbi:hypothetical protein HanRHA438_Chr05g0233971 [Helianthus annuus]|nr:hypothetical protein HanRHA438_Chr05g0233971 [Helianthus annuus]